jgi:hypothetical protein
VCRKQTIEKLLLFFLKENGKSKSAAPLPAEPLELFAAQ